MKFKNLMMPFILGICSALATVRAAELEPATNNAWEGYVRAAEQRMQARVSPSNQFLWLDEVPGGRLRAREGATLVAPMTATGSESVPHGLIHHWVGAAFIPHVTLAGARQVLNDYDNYQQYYKPAVVESKVFASSDDRQDFSMRSMHRTAMATAVFETQYVAHDFRVDATRAYSVTSSTRIQEIENFGRPGERILPPGRGRGYVWRVATICRLEQGDGGVYVETETIVLSRDIPAPLRRLVSPFVARLSVDEMTNSLQQTRDAIRAAANKTMVAATETNPKAPPHGQH